MAAGFREREQLTFLGGTLRVGVHRHYLEEGLQHRTGGVGAGPDQHGQDVDSLLVVDILVILDLDKLSPEAVGRLVHRHLLLERAQKGSMQRGLAFTEAGRQLEPRLESVRQPLQDWEVVEQQRAGLKVCASTLTSDELHFPRGSVHLSMSSHTL